MSSSCSPIRQNFRKHLSNSMFSDMSIFSKNNYFLTIGKVSPWETESVVGLSSNYASPVPIPKDSDETETDFWINMVAAKRLTENNISLVVPRFDWKFGSIYEPYNTATELFDVVGSVKFYVLVDETRVYKCIDNFYNAPSTVPPTHTDTEIRKLSDGYRWKFMYQITENKRKFITKTVYDEGTNSSAQFQRIVNQGYIPIEYVNYLKLLDEDRLLQWNVQESANDGEIPFVLLKSQYKPYLTAVNCILPNETNTIQQNCFAGHTGSIRIYSPYLVGIDDFYNDLIFSVDSGSGEGQRRVIKSYTYVPLGNYAKIVLNQPLSLGLSGSGSENSKFSIAPNLKIKGDGTSKNTYLNNFEEADITVKYGNTLPISTDVCKVTNIYNQTLISSFEMVDAGKGYSKAEFSMVKGLTFTAGFTGIGDINDIAKIMLSPKGGHGNNATKELGSSAIMVVMDFDQDEKKKLSVDNDYRQFAIIQNPILKNPQIRLRLKEWGNPNSFYADNCNCISNSKSYGLVLKQGYTGFDGITGFSEAQGNILSWNSGVSGFYGTSELILDSVTTGNFSCGGLVSSLTGTSNSGNFTIVDIETRDVAGTEGRELFKLKVSPINEENRFNLDGSDFRPGLWVNSVGNQKSNISNSRFNGLIHKWELKGSSLVLGNLYVENSNKSPTLSENIVESDFYMKPIKGTTGFAKILDIDSIVTDSPIIYDQSVSLYLETKEPNLFFNKSFSPDLLVYGTTGSSTNASGVVIDWNPDETKPEYAGVLRMSGVEGQFSNTQLQFINNSGSTANCLVSNVLHEEDLLYRSGQLMYIQNTQPIKRNIEQKEEIKILFQF